MKKRMIVFALVLAIGSLAAPQVSHAADYENSDSIIDKVSDWFAVMGKPKDEQDTILAQRKAERVAKRLKEAMKEMGKDTGKAMEKMGKDMEKAFGS